MCTVRLVPAPRRDVECMWHIPAVRALTMLPCGSSTSWPPGPGVGQGRAAGQPQTPGSSVAPAHRDCRMGTDSLQVTQNKMWTEATEEPKGPGASVPPSLADQPRHPAFQPKSTMPVNLTLRVDSGCRARSSKDWMRYGGGRFFCFVNFPRVISVPRPPARHPSDRRRLEGPCDLGLSSPAPPLLCTFRTIALRRHTQQRTIRLTSRL